ncbi:2-hydroxyacyl-CoA dehydratase subunit D [Candidatus Solincola sp.]|nr:2-hydroxyacyl-CoA dehydratase family protein [Actinomycetota bacterium]MDI7251299.1 2-hydroxyacyl-CoA dehydratase family protein [Actinomycetota bacterium]
MSAERENGLLEAIKERYLEKLSPEIFRSRLFWKTVEGLARSPLNRPQWKADRVSLSHFIRSTRDAYLGKAPVVWCNLLVPSELVHGLGCLPFYPEMAAAVVASAGLAPRFIDRAVEEEFSSDACSYHRCLLGCAVEGFLPRPDLLLSVNYPCDSAVLSFAFLSELYGVPHLVVDVPLPGREEDLPLLAGQLEEAASEMARLSGRDREGMLRGLAESIELSNRALSYLRRVEEMRKRDDCTLDGKDAMGNVSVLAGCMGSEAGVEFYRLLAEELRERGCRGPRSLRLMWMHLKPWYAQSIFQSLERHGARLVCEEYTHATWEPMDPGDPFVSLAAKLESHFLVGPAERRAAHLARLAEEYRVDGAIHFNHWGCRQSCGGAPLVKRALQEKGVPVLIIDGDCVDQREYQEGQISTRLEAFLESLR